MTYCVGMLLDRGIVMVSDSRTNAGVDNISTFRKVTVFQKPRDRVFVLMTAGNLAASQPGPTSSTPSPCSTPPAASVMPYGRSIAGTPKA
jgi:hypothetical protein